jgi:hypothetical protein
VAATMQARYGVVVKPSDDLLVPMLFEPLTVPVPAQMEQPLRTFRLTASGA